MKTPVAYVRWLLGYDGVPKMARPTLRYDLLSTLFGSLGMGSIMPALTSQFASKGMETSIWIVGLLFAQRSVGNLLATFFAQDLARRPRVPMVVMARAGMGLFLACIAALPPEKGLAGSYAALLLTPYLLATLVTNLQSVARHSNYPVNARGRIFSRLAVVQMGSLAVSVMLAGVALDRLGAAAHPLTYLVSSVCLFASAAFYSKIRIRREKAMLRRGSAEPVNLLAGFRILAEDRTFALFMLWQMIFGLGNIMTHPALTKVMDEFMDHYGSQGFGYGWAMAARAVTPLAVVVCVAPLAGRLFDRVRITRFRGIGASMWGISKLLVFLSAGSIYWATAPYWPQWAPWVLLFAAFAVQGVGQAVGNIAYNLGHMNFTSPHRGHDYMGIHLTLQGVRGMAGPMIGAALFQVVGFNILPIAGAMIFVGVAGFLFMKPPARPEVRAARAEAAIQRPLDAAGKSI